MIVADLHGCLGSSLRRVPAAASQMETDLKTKTKSRLTGRKRAGTFGRGHDLDGGCRAVGGHSIRGATVWTPAAVHTAIHKAADIQTVAASYTAAAVCTAAADALDGHV